MERLTIKNNNWYHYPYCFREDTCGGMGYSNKCDKCGFLYKVCEKLGRLEDLADQGRLLELPCAVGDTVYKVEKSCSLPLDCPLRPCRYCTDYPLEIKEECFLLNMLEDIGKTVFLTYGEAEEALKRMRMSNDLISRSTLIEEFYKRIGGDLTFEEVEYIEKVTGEIPIVYDVDKVVGRLESQKSGLTTWAEDEAYKLGIEKAIEIVKSGGIE